MQVKDLNLNEIFADDDFNCRGKIKKSDILELMESIKNQGLLQPVTVVLTRNVNWLEGRTGKIYSLIMGFRRFRACEALNLPTIRCLINDEVKDERSARVINFVENVQRHDLDILQEARSIQTLVNLDMSRKEICKLTGMRDGWVQLRMMILSFSEDVQKEIIKYKIAQNDIRRLYTILGIDGEEAVIRQLKKIKESLARGAKKAQITVEARSDAKRQRNKTEMIHLLDFLYDFYEVGLHSRVLAWAAGNISNEDLDEELEIYAIAINKPYRSFVEYCKDI